jgi:hypothetical protein
MFESGSAGIGASSVTSPSSTFRFRLAFTGTAASTGSSTNFAAAAISRLTRHRSSQLLTSTFNSSSNRTG